MRYHEGKSFDDDDDSETQVLSLRLLDGRFFAQFQPIFFPFSKVDSSLSSCEFGCCCDFLYDFLGLFRFAIAASIVAFGHLISFQDQFVATN